jgi:hypothetical protein
MFLFSMKTTMEKRERLVIRVATTNNKLRPISTTSLLRHYYKLHGDGLVSYRGGGPKVSLVMYFQFQVVITIVSFVVCCVLCSNFSNVTGEWFTLLLGLREVSGSNLGAETGYSNVFRCISQSLQANAAVVP